MPGDAGELMFSDLAPDGFQGLRYTGGKSSIMMTKGVGVIVRVMVSTDRLVLVQ